MAKPAKRGKKVSVDFSGVESGGGRAIPDGNYTLTVVKITEEESSEGNPYLKWQYKVADGKLKGATVYDNTSLQPQSLWRLKTLLECLGEDVPDSSMELDLAEYVGKSVDAEITNEKYEGKDRPRVTGFIGAEGTADKSDDDADDSDDSDDDSDDSDDEEETSKKKPAKKTPAKTSKFKEGQKVTFEDGGKTLTGVITALDGTTATVDVKGEEWELETSELSAK